MRCSSPLLLAATLAWAPGATSADSAAADATTPPALVTQKDGKLDLAQFESCEIGERKLQVLIHAEADAAGIDRDRFVAASARASLVKISELAGSRKPGDVTCRAIDAPVGDVDYEVEVKVSRAGVEVSSVDVNERNALVRTGYLSRQRRAQGAGSEAPPGPCAATTMGRVFCAHAAEGVAVRTTMGEVVCARGECVRQANGRWHCSRASGGWAELTLTGPECEQGCYEPTQLQCRAA